MALIKLDSGDYINTGLVVSMSGDQVHTLGEFNLYPITHVDHDKILEAMGYSAIGDYHMLYRNGDPAAIIVDGIEYRLSRLS